MSEDVRIIEKPDRLLVVTEPEEVLIVEEVEQTVLVTSPGPQGIQGEPGVGVQGAPGPQGPPGVPGGNVEDNAFQSIRYDADGQIDGMYSLSTGMSASSLVSGTYYGWNLATQSGDDALPQTLTDPGEVFSLWDPTSRLLSTTWVDDYWDVVHPSNSVLLLQPGFYVAVIVARVIGVKNPATQILLGLDYAESWVGLGDFTKRDQVLPDVSFAFQDGEADEVQVQIQQFLAVEAGVPVHITPYIAVLDAPANQTLGYANVALYKAGGVGATGPQGDQGEQGPPGSGTGPQGPPGPPGSNFTYVHNQASPASVWSIMHNLGGYPNVTVEDSGGNEVSGDITYVDANNIVLSFNASFSGQAFLS